MPVDPPKKAGHGPAAQHTEGQDRSMEHENCILELRDVSKGFHRIKALDRVNIGFRPATVHQELMYVPHMTVAENILLAREPAFRFLVRIDRRKARGKRDGFCVRMNLPLLFRNTKPNGSSGSSPG